MCSTVDLQIPKFHDLIRLVYTRTQGDNELRKVIVDQVTAGDMNGMEDLMEELHDFSKDVANRLLVEVRMSRKRVLELEMQEQSLAKLQKRWGSYRKCKCRDCMHRWGVSACSLTNVGCPICGKLGTEVLIDDR